MTAGSALRPLLLLLGTGGWFACASPGPGGKIFFTDVSAGSGIRLMNVSGDPRHKTAITETVGQGAAALDYDGDGRLDLFVVNGDALPGRMPAAEPRPALYRNLGGFEFEDVTEKAGLAFRAFGHGATAIDFDADGHTDLYVTVFLGPNRFFRNRGDGTFEDATARWGGGNPAPSTAAAFFDADGDDDLDLYVGNYVRYEPDRPPNHGQPCRWRGLVVVCGPRGTTAVADVFYENRGGTLVEATSRFGFGDVAASYTLGAIAGDIDGDGDTDLYVANDSEPNYLFLNLGGGRFRDAGLELGVDRNEDGRAQAGMGVDLGDVDNDGHFDLFVTNFSHDTNTLYHSLQGPDGRTMFEDLTYAANLGLDSFRMLSWGTGIVDLDQDGWQDLVVVSGHVYPEVAEDTAGTTYEQPNQIFWNDGPGASGAVTFRPFRPAAGDAFERRAVSRGLVLADLDDDGDSDFLVVEMHDVPTLVRNDVPKRGGWVGFRLCGRGGNREAIGARLEVEDSRGLSRVRQRTSGASFLSTDDPRLVVGLGEAAGAVRVTVDWPGGERTVNEGLAPGRYWLLDASAEPIALDR